MTSFNVNGGRGDCNRFHRPRDLEKIRAIRNELERRGCNPLLFFLISLEDDDARLPELMREEIRAARVNTPKTQAGAEVELIKGMEGKVFETVDLGQELETELHKIVRLSKRSTVFLSQASADRQIAEVIRRALL